MKELLFWVSIILVLGAILSIPAGIIECVYTWSVMDFEFADALWEGVKTWLIMLLSGLFVGFPMYMMTKD